jgi:hypothetical protein
MNIFRGRGQLPSNASNMCALLTNTAGNSPPHSCRKRSPQEGTLLLGNAGLSMSKCVQKHLGRILDVTVADQKSLLAYNLTQDPAVPPKATYVQLLRLWLTLACLDALEK